MAHFVQPSCTTTHSARRLLELQHTAATVSRHMSIIKGLALQSSPSTHDEAQCGSVCTETSIVEGQPGAS